MYFDTHSHIYLNKKFSEEEIVKNLENDNVKKIVCIWIDIESSKKCIEIAKKYPWIVYASVWIHPNDIKQYLNNIETTFNVIEHLILNNLDVVVWVWETGFDFHYIEETEKNIEKQHQELFFTKHIELAKKYDLPVIIHSRDSKEETIELLKKVDFKKFILHCFSEDMDFAFKAIYFSEICKISFSWIVTYKSATNIQNVAANIPLERIIIETDCPYLSPQEVRWTENFPNNIKYTAKKIFELREKNWKKENYEDFLQKIYNNSLDIFDL